MDSPKIRFKGCMEAWEQRKLGEISSLITKGTTPLDKTGNGEVNFIKIENIDSSSGEIIPEMKISIEEHNGYLKRSQLKENDILFSIAGTLGRVSVVKSNVLPANTNQALAIIRTKEGDLNYLATVLKGRAVSDFIKKNPTVGAQPNLSLEQVGNLEIPYPSFGEQQVIGEYFTTLDLLITLHQRKCGETKKLKKYMLQKMFPKDGERVPEIRFSGFTNAWEQRKFGDLADYKKGPFGSAITKDMFVPKDKDSVKVYEQQNAINKDWSLERYFLPKEYVLTKLKSFEVYGGDIIVSCAGTIGEIYEIPQNAEAGVINQALMRVRVNEDIVDKSMFTIAFSNMIDEFTRTHSNGSAIKNIPPFADLKPMQVLIPSMSEQKKISGYFCHLDRLITLHQRKCDELRQVKRFMLENMFV